MSCKMMWQALAPAGHSSHNFPIFTATKSTYSLETTLTLYTKHAATLKEAIDAAHSRKFYAKYPEHAKAYGETAPAEGLKAFQDHLGKVSNDQLKGGGSHWRTKDQLMGGGSHWKPYEGTLAGGGSHWLPSGEISPYTLEPLGIAYPGFNLETTIGKSRTALKTWRKVSAQERAGILTEALERIKNRFFELAYATMHTTGQAFMMSFQASGPHSNDRALEAIALGLYEQGRFPANVEWVKPMGKMDVTLHKHFLTVPRGISVVIGCSTFPVWNSVPGMFASLVTGNTAIVKPHPGAIYPLAIVVEEVRAALAAGGCDPETVQMMPDRAEDPITKKLCEQSDVKIIDYTGGNAFGDYVESLKGKYTFTEKAGINSLVLHSVKDLAPVMQNISFGLSLYSGQMCTCPQNVFIPKDGITAGGAHLSFDATVAALCEAIKGLVTNEKMGPGTLGAVQSEMTFQRVKQAEALGCKVVLPSMHIVNPEFPKARIATPTVIVVPAEKADIFSKEWFGPIVLVIATETIQTAVGKAKKLATEHGAITFSAYTTDEKLMHWMTDEMAETFTSVSFNFTGPIWVNQSAGFSDFHVTGGNPAGNASLTDPEFVTRRFEIVGVRIGQG